MPGSVLSYRRPETPTQLDDQATLAEQLPSGRLVEIVASRTGAQLTAAIGCLRRAQQHGETAVWIQPEGGSLFPPDLHDSGVDLDGLLVVNVPTGAGPFALAKAAEMLLRSGGFGIVILDLSESKLKQDVAWQGRLLGLAREHRAWLLLLSDGDRRGSLGPLISLCIEPRRQRKGRASFDVEHHIRKDKSGLLSSLSTDRHRGPWGLT